MEWNTGDWQFLTPSSTPTDATFDCHSLQTPNPSAHFQDAFHPYLSQNNGHVSATPTTTAMDFHENNYMFAQDNAHMQWMQAASLQQQQPTQQIPTMTNHALAPAPPIENSHQRPPSSGGYTGPADPYQMQMQMQTPPPTRGSPTKRRSQRAEPVVFGTPSSLPARRSQANRQIETNHARQVSFDPSLEKQAEPLMQPASFQLPTSTAAQDYMPLQAVTWAQSSAINPTSHAPQWPSLDDPFTPWSNPGPVGQNTDIQPSNRVPRSSSHASLSFPSTSLYQQSRAVGPYPDHISPQRMASVDPSLVFSSPTRPVTADNSRSNPFPRPSSSASGRRVPYEHQPQDPRREMLSVRSTRSGQQASTAAAKPSLAPPSLRSGLQRSNTISGSQSNIKGDPNSGATSGTLGRSNSAASLSRRTSPLKRVNRGSLCSISETPKPIVRTSVVLRIDENGRARTETQVVEDSPTKSLREKYPTLWDDSDSESDSVGSKQWPSRNSSLVHNKSDERQPKATKLEPPSEGIESLHLQRSNSTTSLKTPSKAAYAAAAQIRRQSSVKKQQRTTVHGRRNTLASLNSSFESLGSFDQSTDDRHAQKDAGSALREAVAGRAPQKDQQIQPDPILPTNTTQPLHDHRRTHHQKSRSFAAPPPQHQHQQPPPPFDRSSSNQHHPIPVDFAPMQPAEHFQTSSPTDMMKSVTRCICAFPLDDGRGMLQCSFCSMWLHAACLGLDPQRLPASYVCSFCTSSAQAIRTDSARGYAHAAWGVVGI